MSSKIDMAYRRTTCRTKVTSNYYAAKLASEHVKVVLSGTGGDEIFAGNTLGDMNG